IADFARECKREKKALRLFLRSAARGEPAEGRSVIAPGWRPLADSSGLGRRGCPFTMSCRSREKKSPGSRGGCCRGDRRSAGGEAGDNRGDIRDGRWATSVNGQWKRRPTR